MTIEFGSPIPQVFPGHRVDTGLIKASLQVADESGFQSVWTQDQVIDDAPLMECMSLLAYAAACTTRVRRFSEGVAVMQALWTEPRATLTERPQIF